MDNEMRACLEAMETRLTSRQDSMETRMMARINDNQGKLLERVRSVESNLNALTELGRSTNTLLIPMANVVSDLVKRVTDLEKKP